MPGRGLATMTAFNAIRTSTRLVTCGAFTPEGEFPEVPEFDMDRLQAAWREAMFALHLGQQKIGPGVVEKMHGWPHRGFSVDQSAFLLCRPATGRGSSVWCNKMTSCPFSLFLRLIKGDHDRAAGPISFRRCWGGSCTATPKLPAFPGGGSITAAPTESPL